MEDPLPDASRGFGRGGVVQLPERNDPHGQVEIYAIAKRCGDPRAITRDFAGITGARATDILGDFTGESRGALGSR
jgi:hypothetical protein